MPQVTFSAEWEGQPSPAPLSLPEEAETAINEKLGQISELKNELVELEKELEIVEAQEIDLDPAEGEEVTYDGLAPHLEEELKEQRYENEASIEVLVMEIKAIRETGVVI
jgi:hypothetical protein